MKKRSKAFVWFWRVLAVVIFAIWLYFAVSGGLPWYHVLWTVPVGSVLSFLLIVMLYATAEQVAEEGFDKTFSDEGSRGSSSGVEWDRLATWYLRGRMRNQMRKFWR